MNSKQQKWFYLILLSLVWGSSFILINLSLKGLTPIQVGAFRILISSIVLLLVAYKSILSLTKNNWFWLSLNAMLGTFFPAFLFAYAINKMDSSIAAILNSFTPLNTLIFGALLFGYSLKKKQLFGVLIGLIGTVLLIYFSNEIGYDSKTLYMSFILIASLGYAINVNIIKKHLQDVKAIAITTGNFALLIIPTSIVLFYSLKYENFDLNPSTQKALAYICVLAVFGTAIAKTLFNKLVQISTPIFSASVTYLIPIVAVFWGFIFGENLNLMQFLSGFVIFLGVYLANKTK
ncbi:MAG: DMT family transporter [Flavobacteriaceae bacterium]|nr:DMT family transporter [Flavobacteriaceae bacterium]